MFHISKGVSYNKLLSKLGGSCLKPDGQTVVGPSSVPLILSRLDTVRGIPGVGRRTAEALAEVMSWTVWIKFERFSSLQKIFFFKNQLEI